MNKSKCCKKEVEVSTADEGTSCYICSSCGKPCDLSREEKGGDNLSPPLQCPTAWEADVEKPSERCGTCGGKMVEIRAKYPNEEPRTVCPTCLAERMDTINEISGRNYGVAYKVDEQPQ